MPCAPFKPDDIVRTCPKLENGLFLGIDGLRSCARGALLPPLFCTREEIVSGVVNKELIVERRKQCITMLNDDYSEMDCKRCLMVEQKRYGDIDCSRLGHVDLQHYTICNLRCSYCSYARGNSHVSPQYDALELLRQFSPDDIEWNAHVDFAGGEPTLLENLDEYLEFFRSSRIRVLMHTNGVRFHKAIYNGLADGSLYWVTVSLDAGTPSTYKQLRGGDYYLQVLENLSRYAVAGSKGKGMLSVKYIFCESNCGDDDIAGFAYAMLALRPQQVWLTFDFTPLYMQQEDYDYSRQIESYAKLYLLLKKHGVEAFHYYKEAIGTVSKEGKEIMSKILDAIERLSTVTLLDDPDLKFADFRIKEPLMENEPNKFSIGPLMFFSHDEAPRQWSLEGKRVLLAPACPLTKKLLADPGIQRAGWIGFLDRNPVQQGKSIDGWYIYSYEDIPSLDADVILVASPEKHRVTILDTILRNSPVGVQVAELR